MKKYIKSNTNEIDYCLYYNGDVYDFDNRLDIQIKKLKSLINDAIVSGDIENIDLAECQVTSVPLFLDANGDTDYDWDNESVEYCADTDEDFAQYIKSSTSEICYRDRDNDDRVVALDVGMSADEVEEMLAKHPSYYRSTLDEIDASTKPKYFANMVSASSDDYEQLVPYVDDDSIWEEPKYHAKSYYDGNYRGLEDDYLTDDPSALIDWIWDHAASGGFIQVCGPKDCVRLDPDDLENRIATGAINEYDIISQIDYL